VITGICFASLIIVGRLVAFQVIQGAEWADRVGDEIVIIDTPQRGTIYDRNGAVLAANGADYQVSVSPNMVLEPEQLATALTPILQMPRLEIVEVLTSDSPFRVLHGRVSPELAESIRSLPYDGLQLDPLPRRYYPQQDLLCHTLGYVDFDGIGGAGLEAYYQLELAGEVASATNSISPLTRQDSVIAREGSDLVLTIDRSVQNLVEQHLRKALRDHGAVGGTIIVLDPGTGAILANANLPCYSAYRFFEEEEGLLTNPSISHQFEPGSVMKLITMAAALDSGSATVHSTYYDAGVIGVGGHRTYNWDRSAPGTTDMTTLLSRSLNVGAATLASWMGPETFYEYLERFGFGRPTGIDLLAEASGTMPVPGDDLWTESFLATNAYGQSLAVTPLQMVVAASALANDGYLMQPHIVQEIRGDSADFVHQPTVLSRPISREAAQQVTSMAVTAVAREVPMAQVDGYTIAGKTGTAQIAENGIYLPDDVIGSFIGWLPADDPEIIVFVKLDRPKSAPWGSETAAPVFAELAEEMVVLLGIPPDNVRLRADITAARLNN
jgi:cell division protein FtsI/penicillin-binding protein 2